MFFESAEGLQENCQRLPTNLLAKQPKTTTRRLHATYPFEFELSNVSKEDIKKILLNLDTSKAVEMDQIPAKCLRDGAEVLALTLRNIINLLIKLSTFPEECKIAKLKPLFKKGSRTNPKNYRPISFLTLVSKKLKYQFTFK